MCACPNKQRDALMYRIDVDDDTDDLHNPTSIPTVGANKAALVGEDRKNKSSHTVTDCIVFCAVKGPNKHRFRRRAPERAYKYLCPMYVILYTGI